MLNNSSAIQRFYLFIVIFHRLQKEHQQLHLWFLQHIDLIHFFLVSKFYTCDSEEKESTKEYQTDNGGRKTNFENSPTLNSLLREKLSPITFKERAR